MQDRFASDGEFGAGLTCFRWTRTVGGGYLPFKFEVIF